MGNFFSDIGDSIQHNVIDPVRHEASRAGRRIEKEVKRGAADILRSEIGSMATLGLGENIAEVIDPTEIVVPDPVLPDAPDLRAQEVQDAIMRERQRSRRGRASTILTGAGLTTAGDTARTTLLGG